MIMKYERKTFERKIISWSKMVILKSQGGPGVKDFEGATRILHMRSLVRLHKVFSLSRWDYGR